MKQRSLPVALFAIGLVALMTSVDALLHSYAGLYGWAVHHRLGGWQALTWPAEIDVFLVIGELALYVAYLDDWPARQRLWPWVTAGTGLVVSVAGNIGHVQALPGAPATIADRVTAAVSPVAAFAGLMIGLLVLKMNGQRPQACPEAATHNGTSEARAELLADAARLLEDARLHGKALSRRALAAQLRERGHRFANEALREVADNALPDDLAA